MKKQKLDIDDCIRVLGIQCENLANNCGFDSCYFSPNYVLANHFLDEITDTIKLITKKARLEKTKSKTRARKKHQNKKRT